MDLERSSERIERRKYLDSIYKTKTQFIFLLLFRISKWKYAKFLQDYFNEQKIIKLGRK